MTKKCDRLMKEADEEDSENSKEGLLEEIKMDETYGRRSADPNDD